MLPSSVQQGASQLQLCVLLGPSGSLSVESAGCLVCRCVGLLRDGLRTFGWDSYTPGVPSFAVQQLPGATVTWDTWTGSF